MKCYRVTAVTLTVVAWLFNIGAFITPHWLVSWPQKHSTFERTGLWEMCVRGFTDPRMYAYKYYYGCWWILHPEFYAIQDMIMPPWFTAVQVFSVLSLVGCFVGLICAIVSRRNHAASVSAAVWTFIATLSSLLELLIFGICAKDRAYSRMPDLQYLYFGAGYGFAAISAIASAFAFVYFAGYSKSLNRENTR